MNGVVKWLFVFVFGFIAAFTFMFHVNGSLEQSNQGVVDLTPQPYYNGEKHEDHGITYIVNGKTIYAEGVVTGRSYSLYLLRNMQEIQDLTKNAKITISFSGNYGINYNTYARAYVDIYDENKNYLATKTVPSNKTGWIQEDLIPEQYIGKAKYIKPYIQVIDVNESGYKYHFMAKITITQETEATGTNMLTWFSNIINSTRQQSFWDFVKKPVQRFIDKMSYFDSLEKPSFGEVLTAIWNVFLLILSPIEITGRALWWLALVLYDLIPLLLNPAWT